MSYHIKLLRLHAYISSNGICLKEDIPNHINLIETFVYIIGFIVHMRLTHVYAIISISRQEMAMDTLCLLSFCFRAGTAHCLCTVLLHGLSYSYCCWILPFENKYVGFVFVAFKKIRVFIVYIFQPLDILVIS